MLSFGILWLATWLSEILKRLDVIAVGQASFREEQAKIWLEIKRLREDMTAGLKRHDEENAKLRADIIEGEASFRASSNIIDEINQKIEMLKEKHPEKLRPKTHRKGREGEL